MSIETEKKPKTQSGGCLSAGFMLMGGLTLLFAIIGYILHFFDMVIKVSGSKLPMIDTPIFFILLAFGFVFLGLGWGIGKIEDMIQARKEQKKTK